MYSSSLLNCLQYVYIVQVIAQVFTECDDIIISIGFEPRFPRFVQKLVEILSRAFEKLGSVMSLVFVNRWIFTILDTSHDYRRKVIITSYLHLIPHGSFGQSSLTFGQSSLSQAWI
jgi:hypothetical protein